MAEMQEFEVLSTATNAIVARHPGRNHPGILVQGDSLRSLLDEVEELVGEAEAQDMDAVKEIAGIVRGRLVDLLSHYEAVLDREGREVPYTKRVTG